MSEGFIKQHREMDGKHKFFGRIRCHVDGYICSITDDGCCSKCGAKLNAEGDKK